MIDRSQEKGTKITTETTTTATTKAGKEVNEMTKKISRTIDDDYISLKTLAITNVILEIVHVLNSYFVKNREDYPNTWKIHSMLDSYVIHTIMFLVLARYFRIFNWREAILYFMARILAEGYLPKEYGGMMAIKENAGNMPNVNYAASGACYLIIFAMTQYIVIREQILHPLFLFAGAWGYCCTILPAGYYLKYGPSCGYYVAHLANIITFNPALVAIITGYGEGPVATSSIYKGKAKKVI